MTGFGRKLVGVLVMLAGFAAIAVAIFTLKSEGWALYPPVILCGLAVMYGAHLVIDQ